MTTEYSVSEMLSFYEEIVKEIAKTERDMKKAAKMAKESLKNKYPDNIYSKGASLAVTGRFWTKAWHILKKYYPFVVTPKNTNLQLPTFAFQAVNQPEPNGKKSFRSCVQAAALTGFIPYAEYLNPFAEVNSGTLAAEISHLRNEGYTAERNGKGWIITAPEPKETPEEKAAREAKEQREKELKSVKDQIAALMTIVEKLSK